MKKFILLIILVLTFISYHPIYAGDNETIASEYSTIEIEVWEAVPWANCEKINEWKYKCTVKTWFWSVQDSIWAIIKYFTFITWLLWVLYIVINWILLSMWWLDSNMQKSTKDNIKKALVWVILLFISWLVLNMIAPWIYQ